MSIISRIGQCSAFVPAILAVGVIAGAWPQPVMSQTGAGGVTSAFGVRRDPFTGAARMHAGTDMSAPHGHYVYATGDGVVQRARWVGGYGLLVELAHGYGYQSRFGHLSKIFVREGQMVRRGQPIGQVGSTGRSTGPHLHYEVRINGRAVDSRRYMQIVFANPPAFAAQQPASVQASLAPRRADRSRSRAVGQIAMEPVEPNGGGSVGGSEAPPQVSFGHVRGTAMR